MSPVAVTDRFARTPPLCAALDDALAPDGTCPLDGAVPASVWRRALAGPAAEFLARPGKALRARIVRAGYALGGGKGELPEALALAVEILHAGSLIIDDIQDQAEHRRGAPALHHLIGTPLAINTGSWMYFWALAELGEAGLPPAVELAVHRAAITTLARCHQGQALDLATRIGDVDAQDVTAVVDATTRLKTGTLCQFAAELGARAAGAEPARQAAIGGFGMAMGKALQMLDDLGSLTAPSRREKGREDLRGGRPTWPWAWLAEAGAPFAWARLVAMSRAVAAGGSDVDALADELADEVEELGRQRVRAALDAAITNLRDAVGPGPAVDALDDDLRAMEASYG
ncbi:MAG: polyprenyl synthetase family protein [Deltaproteobacteria bacterium]|nr:polyprenyl synthetase family protein [Deltaproteobacteria bacterium]